MNEITILTKEDKGYKTWIYNRIDGEMVSKIVGAKEAEELFEAGWRMSPAEFTEDKSLKDSPEFQAITDDMAVIMNTLINIDKIDDKRTLVDFAKNFLKMKVPPRINIDTLRDRINKEAQLKGLFE